MINERQYLNTLYAEYCKARGVQYKDDLYNKDAEFIEWIIDYYKDLLEGYKGHLSSGSAITSKYQTYYECDKGIVNSIVDESHRISAFNYEPSRLLLVENKFRIESLSETKKVKKHLKFLTFNPAIDYKYDDFIKLHKQGNPVIFSVIGNNNDEDKWEKIRQLENMSKSLCSNYDVLADTTTDNYYYTIYSEKPKVRTLVKNMEKPRFRR